MANKKRYSIREICNHLETIAPLALQESYDNVGLLIGSYDTKVSGALLTLDCTEEVLQEAKKLDCKLVIAHHPIIFNGLKKINDKHYVERIVRFAIKNDIAIYASHTNMDNTLDGVNKQIAEKLGITDFQSLAPSSNQLCKLYTYVPTDSVNKVKKALFDAGAGKIGDYENCSFEHEGKGNFKAVGNANPSYGQKNKITELNETKLEVLLPRFNVQNVVQALKMAHPYEEVAYEIVRLENSQQQYGAGIIGNLPKPLKQRELLNLLSKKMKAKGIRFTARNTNNYQKIAVCGGSGAFLIKRAIQAGADAFITGDVKYHDFFEGDNQMSIIDIGHYESEQYTPQLFYSILSKKMPTFALHLSKINTNPIKYF